MDTPGMAIRRIRCAEIWGGIQAADVDICTSSMTASLYSKAADGSKGGDIYYFSVCGADMLTRIAVADVVGHGEEASIVSQWLYEALVARLDDIDGSAVLTDLNQVASDRGFNAITTAAVVGFHLANSNLYFSYAGHPPLWLRRQQEKGWRPALLTPRQGPSNLPLGAMRGFPYYQEEVLLVSGDRLVLYTDGVIEAPDAHDEPFGEERLHAALEAASQANLHELKQAVLAAVRQHTGGSLAHDDVTLMAIEIR